MVLSFLGGIGYTSTLSTFHQYVINPREEDLNGTDLQGVVSLRSDTVSQHKCTPYWSSVTKVMPPLPQIKG
jgi:hypothetical protein